jgi:hypothetical protein
LSIYRDHNIQTNFLDIAGLPPAHLPSLRKSGSEPFTGTLKRQQKPNGFEIFLYLNE